MMIQSDGIIELVARCQEMNSKNSTAVYLGSYAWSKNQGMLESYFVTKENDQQ